MANTVTSTGTPPYLLPEPGGTPPSTITLNGVSTTVTTGGSFIQTLSFLSGYDGLAGPVNFMLQDPFDVDGIDGFYTINGTIVVSPTTDPDTIFLSGALQTIGGMQLQLQAMSFFDSPPFPGGTISQDLQFTATPEPSTFVLIAGVILAFGLTRLYERRYRLH
jgi:hypothetical protein